MVSLTAILVNAIIYCEILFHTMKNFTIQPVENALDIIELFLKYNKELGVSELAKLTGLNISTAHHLASILVSRGYLKQKQRRGPYSLGFKYLEFKIVRNVLTWCYQAEGEYCCCCNTLHLINYFLCKGAT